jgi:hypothetical protein
MYDVCLYVCVCVYIYIYIYICLYVCVCILYVCMYVFMYVCMYVCMCVRMYVYILYVRIYVVLCTCAFGLRVFTVLKYRMLSQCTMEAKKQFLTHKKIYQYNAIMRSMCVRVCVLTLLTLISMS